MEVFTNYENSMMTSVSDTKSKFHITKEIDCEEIYLSIFQFYSHTHRLLLETLDL